jgi:porin
MIGRRARGALGPALRTALAGAGSAALLAPAGVAAQAPAPPDPSGPGGAAATARTVEPRRPHIKQRAVRLTDERRTPDDRSKPWLEWENASGDWGGRRPALQEGGAIVQLAYTAQLFSSLTGGTTTKGATRAAGSLELSLSLDSERLGLWPGGTAFVLFEHQDGRGVSKEVGSLHEIGTLDKQGFTQLSAYYLQQNLLDDRLVLAVGKSDANAAFLDSELTQEFLNGDFSPPPNVPLPSYPEPALGFVAFADPGQRLTLGAGAYGGDLETESYDDQGLFAGRVFAIFETTLHLEPFALPGHYNAGAWLRTLDTQDLRGPGRGSFDRNYGAYVLFDQTLWLEDAAADARQGLEAWFQLSWAPPDRNQSDLWVGGGLVYRGAIPGRDDDLVGFAVASAELTERPDGSDAPSAELVFEWFYGLQLAPWLAIKPDLQYVVNPLEGGPNAVVVGAEWTVGF